MLRSIVWIALLSTFLAATVTAQDEIELELSGQPAPDDVTAIRLLPADPDLMNGNGATVLLRIIWEQQRYMQDEVPRFAELLELPHDAPEVVDGFRFGSFHTQLRRAAHMRDAEWNYPITEEPLALILLPDVQGMRQFVGRGETLWIRQQVANGEIGNALDGIMTQISCSRHVCRTPFVVCHLVGIAIAEMALDNCELVVTEPDCPNLYWALAMLPDKLGNVDAALQWDAEMLERSLPSMMPEPPPMEDGESWRKIAAEFSDFMLMMMNEPLSPLEADVLAARLVDVASEYLIENQQFTVEMLADYAPEAIVMRWVLAQNRLVQSKVEAAHSLPPTLAISQLIQVEEQISEIMEATGAPSSPFPLQPLGSYLAFQRFDRRVKFLQTVEAIRDYVADKGQLPMSLRELRLPAPNDPLTGVSFEYELTDDGALLSMPEIEGVAADAQRQRSYRITLKN